MSWIISVPVWGEPYLTNWNNRGFPALKAALNFAQIQDYQIKEGVPPPSLNTFTRIGNYHRGIIHSAEVGDRIMFLHADMIVSLEAFVEIERRFEKEKNIVVCPAIRCHLGDPPSLTARNLFDWAWSTRHQFTEDCVWGRGQVKLPPYVIWDREGSILMHAFELHPLAIHKTKELEYTGPTPSEIITMFDWNEVSVVDHGEICIAEPAGFIEYARFKNRRFNQRTVLNWGLHFSTLVQQECFRRQIVLLGIANQGVQEKANAWSDRIAVSLHKGLAPVFDKNYVFPGKVWLAMLLPYQVRQWFPKSIRQWILSWDWWQ